MINSPSHLVFVEFNLAGIDVKSHTKTGYRKSVFFKGKHWTTDIVGDRIYLDEVSASFYSEEEITKEDIRIEIGYGRIWCVENDGIRTINIDSLLPTDWFNTVFNMAVGFTRNHYFSAVFTMSEVTDLRPNAGFFSVIGIEISMSLRAADIT